MPAPLGERMSHCVASFEEIQARHHREMVHAEVYLLLALAKVGVVQKQKI